MIHTNPISNEPLSSKPFMGLAHLMRMAISGKDLGPHAQELISRAKNDPDDANALLDLSILLQLTENREIAMNIQAEALALKQLFHLPAEKGPSTRLLAFCAPGDLMSNTPLECLIEHGDISLDLLYVSPHLPFPAQVPDHDVAIIAMAESDPNRPILNQIQPILENWPRPVINSPLKILNLARETAYTLLNDESRIAYPGTVRSRRADLERIGLNQGSPHDLMDTLEFPIIIRPIDSHAGKGLSKIADCLELDEYLKRMPQTEFYVSRFIDYSSADGLFRKFRIVLIEGKPYICHMAISEHWMVHYLNAGMSEHPERRLEEAKNMENFDEGFAQRHKEVFLRLNERINLDYFGIDCAETADGKLLIFEIASAMVVHSMDPEEQFGYKLPQMHKVYSAFRDLLIHTKSLRPSGLFSS